MAELRTSGRWFPRGTTQVVAAEVELGDHELVLHFADGAKPLSYPRDQLRVMARMAGIPLKLHTPDDGLLEIEDGEIARLLAAGKLSLLAWVETNFFKSVLLVSLVAFAVVWSLVNYVVPALAERIAPLVPNAVAEKLGEGIFVTLGDFFEFGSQRPEHVAAQEELNVLGDQLARRLDGGWNYRFYLDADVNARADDADDGVTAPRRGGSPNAFALPSGQIIMTYSLYELLSTEEVAAVLAHEIAHVEKRHSLTALISGSAWFVLSTMMFDAAGVLAAIPTLSELAYSREMELEADCFAAKLLDRSGYNPAAMGSALASLAAYLDELVDEADMPWLHHLFEIEILSTHPEFGRRIELAYGCAKEARAT